MSRELLSKALSVLQSFAPEYGQLIEDIGIELAKTEPDPVAWKANISEGGKAYITSSDFTHDAILYLTGDFESDEQKLQLAKDIEHKLNQTARKPLSDDEIEGIESQGDFYFTDNHGNYIFMYKEFARAIEKAHGIGVEHA